MNEEAIFAEFRAADAMREGHFILSSGLHSPLYLQCARVLANPLVAARLASALVAKMPRDLRAEIEIVVSPAMGGIIAGHEIGRALGVNALFLERPTGTFELRRGFEIKSGAKVMMMEDVVTTGLSSREAIAAIKAAGGKVVAAGAIVDRSAEPVDLGVPFHALLKLEVAAYEADALPPELAAIPAVKPGSRAV
ncbi:MAG: orotate phosphoribosyltransferase [Alphaproteobacteria bacterium]|nr:orotate phosphoribosyltransferase [Alphaproteobacteria bacterium]MDE2340363.1 orotate phosphoribosyltransferase [Alphaproteobacteria bacterium]